jgi:hypothetical protein
MFVSQLFQDSLRFRLFFADTADAESRKSESSEPPVVPKKPRRWKQESADFIFGETPNT